MIEVDLNVVMAKRKVKLSELSKRIGISVTNLSLLKTGKARAIRFSTLNAICEALDCDVGDIIRYQKEPENET